MKHGYLCELYGLCMPAPSTGKNKSGLIVELPAERVRPAVDSSRIRVM
jgi:hypothetical protein